MGGFAAHCLDLSIEKYRFAAQSFINKIINDCKKINKKHFFIIKSVTIFIKLIKLHVKVGDLRLRVECVAFLAEIIWR